MSEQNACPICNEPLEPNASACPRCGFNLIGKTQTFKPVNAASPAIDSTELSATPALEVIRGPYCGESFSLGTGSYTLGRDPSCDIFLSNMTVSRHHATVTVDEDGAYIEDAGSLNGTWVDGKIVDRAPLYPGTRVQIGTFDMIYKQVKN